MRTIAAAALLLSLLAACGQTGPLYLPEEAPPSTAAQGEPDAAANEAASGDAAPASPEA